MEGLMSKKQTLFLHQLMALVDESLKLNRYLIETMQAGPMSEDAYKGAMARLEHIEEKFSRIKANPGE
jgi:hypothetical protein